MQGLGYVYKVTLICDDDDQNGRFYLGMKNQIYAFTHPDQLWDTYYTTNDVVHELIDQYGVGAFTTTILFTSTKPEEITRAYDEALSQYPHIGHRLGIHKCINTEFAVVEHSESDCSHTTEDVTIDLDKINKDYCSPTELLALVRAGRL